MIAALSRLAFWWTSTAASVALAVVACGSSDENLQLGCRSLIWVVLLVEAIALHRRYLAAARTRIRDLEQLADTLQTGIALGGRRGGKS